MIKIDKTLPGTSNAPLYERYSNNIEPQPAYLQMTEDGKVSLDYSGEIGGGVPFAVWHKRAMWWRISPYLHRSTCLDLLEDEDVIELLTRVFDGHSVEWDGNNYVGRLTSDAEDAMVKLQAHLDENYNCCGESPVWDAEEWIKAGGMNLLKDVWPADEPLEKCARRLAEVADLEGIVLDGSIEDALIGWLEGEDPDELSGEHLKEMEKNNG